MASAISPVAAAALFAATACFAGYVGEGVRAVAAAGAVDASCKAFEKMQYKQCHSES
jgi:hypothetical protein